MSSSVYVLQFSGNTKVFKIGKSDNVDSRVSTLERDHGSCIFRQEYPLRNSSTALAYERTLHDQFHAYRVLLDDTLDGYTEFFNISQLKDALDLCDNLMTRLGDYPIISVEDMEPISTYNGVTKYQKRIRTDEFINIRSLDIWSKEKRFDKRIKTKKGSHLKNGQPFLDAMIDVAVGIDSETGNCYKLNGNSRSEAIKLNNLINVPEFVGAMIYVGTMDQLKSIFYSYDNPDASDTSSDMLWYALGANGLQLESPLMKGSISTGIKLAYAKLIDENSHTSIDIRDGVTGMSRGIRELDLFSWTKRDMGGIACSGFIGACVYLLNNHDPNKVRESFKKESIQELINDEVLINDLSNMQMTGAAGSKAFFIRSLAILEALLADKIENYNNKPLALRILDRL